MGASSKFFKTLANMKRMVRASSAEKDESAVSFIITNTRNQDERDIVGSSFQFKKNSNACNCQYCI